MTGVVLVPTDQQGEVYSMIRTQLDGLKTQFKDFVAGDLAAFAADATKSG